MKTILRWSVSLLAVTAVTAFALNDTRITIQSTNVILTWPSAGYESFVVRYRTNMNVASPWIALATNQPAAAGTNRTAFIHYGAFPELPAGSGGGSGGGTGGPPPAPFTVAGVEGGVIASTEPGASFKSGVRRRLSADDMMRLSARAAQQPRPPVPWEMDFRKAQQELVAGDSAVSQVAMSCAADSISSGFYSVILVPDFWFDYSSYVFSQGTEFLPV